jgi:hypothetical protein
MLKKMAVVLVPGVLMAGACVPAWASNGGDSDTGLSILLLVSVIFAAWVGLPLLWWPRRNGIPQPGFTGPQRRTSTRWKAFVPLIPEAAAKLLPWLKPSDVRSMNEGARTDA